MKNIKTIAFDADDTLWHNEPYFDEAQARFCELFQDYASSQEILGLILNHQVKNLPLYGFGIKAFTLSMVETALKITNHTITGKGIEKILTIGKDLLQKPVELLPNVETILQELKGKYKLIVATKGDLKDQHRKLHDSGIGHYFHHIEVLSDKTELDYTKMLGRLEINAQDFLMIGNSLKSDVLPILNIGGYGIHVPYHTTWEYEKIDFEIEHENFKSITSITEILPLLQTS
ncbi:HAD family hydrolase [Flavobacterium sp. HNIBRBA15423]|uniref:HAD family hydrolase n=1 Tax=Flavobacterium sp. HNIBRBA15423 TaxID=3458683 RepID=UPI004044C9DC